MEMSLSLIDLSRPGSAAQARDAAGPEPVPRSSQERRGAGFAEAAVSLTQAGLVGQALMGAAPPPAPSARPAGAAAAPGEPRRAERVLAPWGVPMLPSSAASEARRAATREAALRERAEVSTGATRPDEAGATGDPLQKGSAPRPDGARQASGSPVPRGRNGAGGAAGPAADGDATDPGRAGLTAA